VPGAALTLPANPLGDLDAADLASFIEGTLHETEQAAPRGRSILSDPRLDRARRIGARAAGYVACVVLGLFLGLGFRSGPRAASAPVVATPSPAPIPAAAPSPPPPVPTDEPPTAAQHDCVARVTTTPPGAAITWGDIALGSSPIEHAAVPCGSALVAIRRQHYSEVTERITAEPGRAAVIDQRLHRPPANLVVTSEPPHARIKLNGRQFGLAPHKISTLRFEHVRIEASLAGYRPWKKTVYLKDEQSTVEVTLARLPEPAGHRKSPLSIAPTGATPPVVTAGRAVPVSARTR
jgi:hypothetical protein